MPTPRWLLAFIDLPPATHPAGTQFWAEVTGYEPAPAVGGRREFTPLKPAQGHDYLWVQRIEEGEPRIHLDLAMTDRDAAAELGDELAERHGATRCDEQDDLVVMRSPGGLLFCLVEAEHRSEVPAPVSWADGARGRADQVCLDIPSSLWEVECRFWAAALGAPLRQGSTDDYRRIDRAGWPLRILLQRLGEASGEVRAHLDIAVDDRARETRRHLRLGARVLREHQRWTVLTDPSGAPYCLTDRRPWGSDE